MTSTGQRSTALEKVLCSICNARILGTDWVICARCEVPVHRSCWEYAGVCPIYACGSREYREPLDVVLRPRKELEITAPPGGGPDPAASGHPGNAPAGRAPAGPPPVPWPPGVPGGVPAARSTEDRAALYLEVQRRRHELEARHREMVMRLRALAFTIPGASALPFVVLMMFLAPDAWDLWLGILCCAVVAGVVRQVRARIEAPVPLEVERLEQEIRALAAFQEALQLEPAPGDGVRRP